tara:strand:+ start:4874 stop:5902 length:1029 start_codon:yes stop_codon:yes gene_type:complete
MSNLSQQEWLAQISEEIIDPEQRIIDPHHHLWPGVSSDSSENSNQYLLEDLWADTSSGHNVTNTVFIDCSQCYWNSTDQALNPVGETEFVKKIADESKADPKQATISGIVGHVDMLLGFEAERVLEKHLEIGQELFKGIRHAGGWDPHPNVRNSHHDAFEGLYLQPNFLDGLQTLAKLGYVFEAWQYHHQIPQITELAKQFPDLVIILNHFSGPLGIGSYENKQADIFPQWQKDLKELSLHENVFAKLGGLAMPVNGFGFHIQDKPPTSDEFILKQKAYYETALEYFTPKRCMFESNFPVDKASISYPVLWNAFKKLATSYSASEKDQLFYKTASTVYRITD